MSVVAGISSKKYRNLVNAVAKVDPTDILSLFRAAEFDLRRDLRFANWSGISFAGCDLSGCDFTGARLTGCDFAGARIANARFDQAEVTREQLRLAADWAEHVKRWRRPREVPQDASHLPDGAIFSDSPKAPEMVVIPAGRFMMGSNEEETTRFGREERFAKWERPRHAVEIAQPFALARYAVTFEEYDAFCASSRRKKPKDQGWGRGRRPVMNVSWEDATAYCAWLSDRTDHEYRLPSEAEWEYACRAGTETAFSFGDLISTDLANYDGNYTANGSEKGEYRERTVPVDHDQFTPNGFGLWQMHGNILEWCEDVFVESYEETPLDGSANLPEPLPEGHSRVVRGGSWFNDPQVLRSAIRYRVEPDIRFNSVGFRPARTLFTP